MNVRRVERVDDGEGAEKEKEGAAEGWEGSLDLRTSVLAIDCRHFSRICLLEEEQEEILSTMTG
jgi:hypothetical protein